MQQGGFPGTGWTHDHHQRILLNIQIHTRQGVHGDAAHDIGLAQIPDADIGSVQGGLQFDAHSELEERPDDRQPAQAGSEVRRQALDNQDQHDREGRCQDGFAEG